MHRPSCVRTALAVLALATLPGTTPATARTLPPRCTRVSVSPNYAVDKTALCGVVADSSTDAERPEGDTRIGGAFWVTTDGGRTWHERSALVSALGATRTLDSLAALWVSPNYAVDRLIFVSMTTSGLYASSDLGRTFAQVDAQARQQWSPGGTEYGVGYDQLTPFVGGVRELNEPSNGAVTPQALFAYAGGALNPSALVDPIRKLHVPALGGPGTDLRFVLPRDFGLTNAQGIVVNGLSTSAGDSSAPALFGCTATLTCATPLAQFPASSTVQGIWLAPDYERSRIVYASISPSIFSEPTVLVPPMKAVRSTDGGATFATWTSVQRRVQPYLDAGAHGVGMGLAGNPRFPDRLWLYLYGWGMTGDPAVPDAQLFRSDNRGASWRRTAYYDAHPNGRATGTLVPPETEQLRGPASFELTGNGRLYFTAPYEYQRGMWASTVYCTTDGARFHPGCGA